MKVGNRIRFRVGGVEHTDPVLAEKWHYARIMKITEVMPGQTHIYAKIGWGEEQLDPELDEIQVISEEEWEVHQLLES